MVETGRPPVTEPRSFKRRQRGEVEGLTRQKNAKQGKRDSADPAARLLPLHTSRQSLKSTCISLRIQGNRTGPASCIYIVPYSIVEIDLRPTAAPASRTQTNVLLINTGLPSTSRRRWLVEPTANHGTIVQAGRAIVPGPTPSASKPPSPPHLSRKLLHDPSHNKHHRRRCLDSRTTGKFCLCNARCML